MFTWTAQVQQSVIDTVGSGRSFTTTGQASGNLSIGKNKSGDDVLQITGQAGLFLEVDAPNKTSPHWQAFTGISGFLGLTMSFYSYPGDNAIR